MGIQGLHAFLKPHFVQKKNIKEFSGKTIGVDAMCWMHKGAFACAKELVMGEDSDKFVHFFLRMCETLRYHKIKPVVVFDGSRLPAKTKEETRRQDVREKSRLDALELFEKKKAGQIIDETQLYKNCSAAIRITPSMIGRLMRALRELSIKFLVSPFEADAQLAYMCRTGWVDVVISEDSDLLAYGCPNTFFKMDSQGDGEHIKLDCLQPQNIPKSIGATAAAVEDEHSGADKQGENPSDAPEQEKPKDGKKTDTTSKGKRNKLTSEEKQAKLDAAKTASNAKREAKKAKALKDYDQIDEWSPDMFAQFCTFCGTDYKEPDISIKGFGIKTAFKYVCQFKTPERIIAELFKDKKFSSCLPENCSPGEFLHRYNQIVAVFWHHTVFDPRSGECVSIAVAFPGAQRSLPDLDIPSICGKFHPKSVASRIAKGEIDARTHEPRVQEPFTKAERALMDRMLKEKRQQQASYQNHLLMQESSKRAIEAQKAENATPVPNELGPGTPRVSNLGSAENDATEEDGATKEMCLLKGDLNVFKEIMVMGRNLSEHEQKTPNRETDGKKRMKANPFARKRTSGAALFALACVPKKFKVARQSVPIATGDEVGDSKQGQTIETPVSHTQRMKDMPEYHPRGGFAAKEAALIVLAQKRGVELETLEETEKRGKLTAFFNLTRTDLRKNTTEVTTKLAQWNPRPWEKQDELDPLIPVTTNRPNTLSLGALRSKNVWRQKDSW